jgi:hypothetical protein
MNFRLKSLAFVVAFVALLSQTGLAQEVRKLGTSAAAFLRIPVGARAVSMGSAFVSMADDETALYWNPAGIAGLQKFGLGVDYTEWLLGVDFNFLGLVIPHRSGALGFSVTTFKTGDMDITTPAAPMGTGETFDAGSYAISASYASRLTDRFSIGGTVKYVNERILNTTSAGVAFDVGTIYTTPFAGIRLGASILNFGTKLRMEGEDLNVRVDIAPGQEGNNQSVVGQLVTDEFDMPLIMRIGLSWDAMNSEGVRLTAAADALNPNDNANSVNAGLELALLREKVTLRGGFNDLFLGEGTRGLTLGAGLNLIVNGNLGLSANYAYQDIEFFSTVNRFSLSLSF